MKTTGFSLLLLLSTTAFNAQTTQTNNKSATVRIKKIENVNGVEKITDTTYTTNDPSSITIIGDDNFQITNELGDIDSNKIKKIVIVKNNKIIANDDSDSTLKMKIFENGENMSEDLEKTLLEMGVNVNSKDVKKVMIINNDCKTKASGNEVNRSKMVMVKFTVTDANTDDIQKLSKQIGMADNKLEMNEIKIFPNPHDGKFNLSFNLKAKGDAKVTIFNVEGKEIYLEKLPNFIGEYNKNIDISNNKKGVYFVKIEQGKHAQVKKVVLE